MKNLLCLIIICTPFFGCDQPKPIRSKAQTQNISKYKNLLAKFQNITIDTLEVYSPGGDATVYNGKAVDSINALLFPAEMAERHFNDPPSLFTVYKFAIDSNRIGLLARTPSDYVPSSIKLFFFDKKKDTITSYIELAESWGDEGDFMIKNSWLFRDSSRHLRVLIDVTHGHDNSVDDPKDTTVGEIDYYTLLDLSKPRIDTIFEHKDQLPKKFKNMVSQRTRF